MRFVEEEEHDMDFDRVTQDGQDIGYVGLEMEAGQSLENYGLSKLKQKVLATQVSFSK